MIEVLAAGASMCPTIAGCASAAAPSVEEDDSLLYEHSDQGILGFSETMNRPLQFLDPYLAD